MWRERNLDHPEIVAVKWQGEIEHIQIGKRWCFGDMEKMLAFLRRQAEDPDVPGRSPGEPDENE